MTTSRIPPSESLSWISTQPMHPILGLVRENAVSIPVEVPFWYCKSRFTHIAICLPSLLLAVLLESAIYWVRNTVTTTSSSHCQTFIDGAGILIWRAQGPDSGSFPRPSSLKYRQRHHLKGPSDCSGSLDGIGVCTAELPSGGCSSVKPHDRIHAIVYKLDGNRRLQNFHPMGIFYLTLLFWAIVHGISRLLTARWTSLGHITTGSTCIAQGKSNCLNHRTTSPSC